jgi:hypothetical protein
MKVHLNIRNFHCDLCGIGTFFKSDMHKHIQVHIKKEKKEKEKFYCESCGLEFGETTKRFRRINLVGDLHILINVFIFTNRQKVPPSFPYKDQTYNEGEESPLFNLQ